MPPLNERNSTGEDDRGGDARVAGSGLVWVPCRHEGNSSDSEVEAQAVARIVAELLGGTYTDHQGRTRVLGGRDILVVAPFNAHVARLREALPEEVRVGTVDKFQGRQAPVVIYSLAASSAELAPRVVNILAVKAYQDQLLLYNQDLEAAVRERTRQLGGQQAERDADHRGLDDQRV